MPGESSLLQELDGPEVAFLARHGEVEASPVGRELPAQGATQRIVEADQQPHPKPLVSLHHRFTRRILG